MPLLVGVQERVDTDVAELAHRLRGKGGLLSVRKEDHSERERRRDATHLDLVLCPGVEGETLYFRDVGPQFPVHRGALDAEKDALVPRGPSRVPRAAVGAVVVARFLDEGEDLALVSLGGCLGRHGGAGPGCACDRVGVPSRVEEHSEVYAGASRSMPAF